MANKRVDLSGLLLFVCVFSLMVFSAPFLPQGEIPDLLQMSAPAPAPTPVSTKSVSMSATRTISRSVDISRKASADASCTDSQLEDGTTSITVNLTSDKITASSDGDTFQLQTQGKVDADSTRFSGGGTLSNTAKSDKESMRGCGPSSCPSSEKGQMQGTAKLDLENSLISFDYDRTKREGEYSLQFAFEPPTGDGTVSRKDCNGSNSALAAAMATGMTQLYAVTYGTFSAKGIVQTGPAKAGGNPPPPAPPALPPEFEAAMKKGLDAAGNGGTATIIETKSGFEISYSNSVTLDSMPADHSWEGTSKTTITTSVHISIGGKPVYYDAILVPDSSYKKWVPEGPPPPNSAGTASTPGGSPATGNNLPDRGNQITFRVKLIDKQHPAVEITDVDFTVTYELSDVSSISGFATNYPKSGGDSKPDLRFDPDMQQMQAVDQVSDNRATSKDGEGRSLKAMVRSYDYASRGTFKAKIKLVSNGLDIPAHFENDDKPDIQLPYDANNNHIADAWEEEQGVLNNNYSEKWDSLHLDGNDHDGDGITLFEKYRGFVINGKHERLDPKMKHLFVVDQDKLGLAQHFGVFEKAANGQIKVHVCLPEEMDRIVNPTATEGKGGDQYAIIAKRHTFSDSRVLGEMFPEPTDRFSDTSITSPRDADYLAVSANVGPDLDYTLAHELAHGLGVHHHGNSRPDHYDHIFEKNVLLAPDTVLVDITGAVISKDTITKIPDETRFAKLDPGGDPAKDIPGLEIAKKNSQASGDPGRIMTYNNFFELAYLGQAGSDGKRYITLTGGQKLPDGTTFCRNAKGTLWNDPDHKPGPAFGDAQNGGCWGQINIKTW